jgi:hypothetical protein
MTSLRGLRLFSRTDPATVAQNIVTGRAALLIDLVLDAAIAIFLG